MIPHIADKISAAILHLYCTQDPEYLKSPHTATGDNPKSGIT